MAKPHTDVWAYCFTCKAKTNHTPFRTYRRGGYSNEHRCTECGHVRKFRGY